MSGLDERDIVRSELRWSIVAMGVVTVIMLAVIGAAVLMHMQPPSNVERIDSTALHRSDEFTEANLGTHVDSNGRVTARLVATQFAFVPNCIVLPEGQPVTLRFASPDVIHGILITGTNVNTMVVPGYVAQVHTKFQTTGDLMMPCQEFCGLGHSEMIATVRVVPRQDFRPDAEGRVHCAEE